MPARIGRRSQHGNNRLEVGLFADEPDIVGILHRAGFRPRKRQCVEVARLVIEPILLA